jgi:hypothetical protein
MVRTVIVPGHVVGPKAVELDSPVPPDAKEAQVGLRAPDRNSSRKLVGDPQTTAARHTHGGRHRTADRRAPLLG